MTADRFVGRRAEVATLAGRLADARAGHGGVVLVDGEPGVGKTALGSEVVRLARAQGMTARWGACRESAGAPPYWPWPRILTDLGVGAGPLLQPGADNRFQVFDDVVRRVGAAAAPGGVLIVLDDVHAADVSSLHLLLALAEEVAELRVLVLVLSRPAQPQARDDRTASDDRTAVVDGIRRARSTSAMSLAPLTGSEVEDLVASVSSGPAAAGLLRSVQERAEGNPLFVRELVRLAESGGPLRADPDHRLPPGVRQVITDRLDRLPPPARQVLQQASVLGREFAIELVADLAGTAPSDIADRLSPAVAHALVGEVDGRLRFTHALIREVLYAELTTVERQRLHRMAADAVERRDRGDQDLDALAHHRRLAAADDGRALDATVRAARRARAQLAYEHAARQFGRALRMPRATPQRRWLLLDLADCQFRSGAVSDAWTSCRAAADLGRAAGDAAVMADAALVVRGLTNDPICAEIHGLCRDALAALDGADVVRTARLLGQLAFTADPWAGAPESGLARRALDAAELVDDADARFLALQARLAELSEFGRTAERRALGDVALALGRRTGRSEYTAWAHVTRMDVARQRGRHDELATELVAYAQVVEHMGEPLERWRCAMIRASLALQEGRFGEAGEWADRALLVGRRGGHREVEFMDLVFREHLGAHTGDLALLERVEATVAEMVRTGPAGIRAWHAHILLTMGRTEEAAAVFDALGRNGAMLPTHTVEWVIGATAAVNLCDRLDRPGPAGGIYAALLPHADLVAAARAQSPSLGPVALYLGKLARMRRDLPTAVDHLRAAIDLAGAIGARPFEAMARTELARVLLDRSGPGDARAARAELDTALAAATALGMHPLAGQVRDLLRPGRAGPLSRREDEVAALIAQGLSNRVIADRLHLSERTVETHVRSIFHKLGFTSRASIASWSSTRPPADES